DKHACAGVSEEVRDHGRAKVADGGQRLIAGVVTTDGDVERGDFAARREAHWAGTELRIARESRLQLLQRRADSRIRSVVGDDDAHGVRGRVGEILLQREISLLGDESVWQRADAVRTDLERQ